MSRDAGGKVSVPGISIEGHYKTEYNAPLILESCQHLMQTKKKGRIRNKKEWKVFYHGRDDGSISMKTDCRKEADYT